MDNAKEQDSLKNWYREESNNLPLEEGITACQKENFSWDAGLRKWYRFFLLILLATIIGVQLTIGIGKSESIQKFLLRILAVSSALKWIFKIVFEREKEHGGFDVPTEKYF